MLLDRSPRGDAEGRPGADRDRTGGVGGGDAGGALIPLTGPTWAGGVVVDVDDGAATAPGATVTTRVPEVGGAYGEVAAACPGRTR